jgi:hypothetical protein
MLSDEMFDILRAQSEAGEKASAVKNSETWAFIKDNILGALEDDAIQTLKTAKSEEERLKAQQMFLASRRPEELLDRLILQGKGALEQIKALSTLKEDEKNG